jgi:hypothetical protein
MNNGPSLFSAKISRNEVRAGAGAPVPSRGIDVPVTAFFTMLCRHTNFS